MTNKIETSHSGIYLDIKLRTILNDLNSELGVLGLSTKEDISSAFNKVTKEYYSNLNRSIFKHSPILEGSNPDIVKINNNYYNAYNDLNILYQTLSSIRDVLSSNYNTLSGMSLKLKSDIAEASSKLIDYKIQNTNKFSPLFSDSFFNLYKIENDKTKFTKEKAFIDIFNNNAVLPLNKEAESAKVLRLNIVENSIGTSGNNQELNSLARDALRLAIDGSNDTWFEFEQVGTNELEAPTVLNLKLELEKEIFFNLLDIATVQMPNGSSPAILEIKGSVDGSSFFDLKKLYLGDQGFDSIGNSIIQLGNNLENPNSENLLYFYPKKIKFLSIKLIEDSSYFIRTSSGTKYRRAIGLREIKIKSQKYKNEGQLVTTTFLSNKEISKIGLFTKEYSPAGFESKFDYFISVDDGLNWEEISPTQKIKDKIPEILTYNVDYLVDSKKTDFPIISVKLKADFSIKESEDGASVLSSPITKKQVEFKSIPLGSKILSLDQKPFGQVFLYRTNFGSVGKDTYLKVKASLVKELTDRYLVQMPLDVFGLDSIQIDQEELFIDNYLWTRVDKFLPSHNVNSLVYEFDYLNNIATFHKEENSARLGKKPSGDIFFKLKRENVTLSPREKGTLIKTNFRHDAIKDNISIYSIDESISESVFKLRNLASVHRTGLSEVESVDVLADTESILLSEKDYINGVLELFSNGDYSIDKKRGILYTYKPLSATDEVRINISYKKKNPISFDLNDGELITTEILKKENRTFKIIVPTDTYAINLGFKNIEEKTVSFIEIPSTMKEEVQYSEMEKKFNELGSSGRYAIDYKNGIVYLQEKESGTFSGILINSNYYAEYNIVSKIPETSYVIRRDNQELEFSEKFVSDFFNSSFDDPSLSSLLKVEYSYTEEIKESLSDLLPYVTPFIMEYNLITTPKESL